jgi:hypothetical protein
LNEHSRENYNKRAQWNIAPSIPQKKKICKRDGAILTVSIRRKAQTVEKAQEKV